jgi:glucosylglycerate synthase
VGRLAKRSIEAGGTFHLGDELWAELVLDFSCAYRRNPIDRGQILRSLTPLYLARVASFVLDTGNLAAAEVETKTEQLCITFEKFKPDLVARWDSESAGPAEPLAAVRPVAGMERSNLEVEK